MFLEKDFGLQRPGAIARGRVAITNDSDKVWSIKDIAASCRCTHSTASANLIKPHSLEYIDIVYDCGTHTADEVQRLAVSFHEPGVPSVTITVRAQIRESMCAAPAHISLDRAYRSRNYERIIQVLNYSDVQWDTIDVASDVTWIRGTPSELQPARLHVAPTAPRQTWQLAVSLNAESLAGGRHFATLRLVAKSHDDEVARAVVPVDAQVIDVMSISPDQLFFGMVSPDTTAHKQLVVQFAPDAVVPIADNVRVSHDMEGELQVHIAPRGKHWLLNATFTPGPDRRGVVRGRLLLSSPTDSAFSAGYISIIAHVVDQAQP